MEDGWGSEERSEGKSRHRAEVRSQKNQPSPSASHGKQEIKDHREGGRGEGKADGERQQLRLNQAEESTCNGTEHQLPKLRRPPGRALCSHPLPH